MTEPPATLASPAPPVTPEPARERPWLNKLFVVAGVVISLLAAIFSAVLELFLTSQRIGGVLTGAAVAAAVVGNWAISWFAVSTTGRRWAVAPPWAVWTLIMFLATGTVRPEGDRLVRGDDWIALVAVLVGSLTFAVYTYRLILKGPTVTKK